MCMGWLAGCSQVDLPFHGDVSMDDDELPASASGSGSAEAEPGLTQSQTDALAVASSSSVARDSKLFRRLDFSSIDDDTSVRAGVCLVRCR